MNAIIDDYNSINRINSNDDALFYIDNYVSNSSEVLCKTNDQNSKFDDLEYLTMGYLEHFKEKEDFLQKKVQAHLLKLKKSVNTLKSIDSFKVDYEIDIEFCINLFNEQNLKDDNSKLQLAVRNLRKIR